MESLRIEAYQKFWGPVFSGSGVVTVEYGGSFIDPDTDEAIVRVNKSPVEWLAGFLWWHEEIRAYERMALPLS